MTPDVSTLFDASVPYAERAMQVFEHVKKNLPVYRTFAASFPDPAGDPHQIPLIPVRAFQDFDLIADGIHPETVFQSSGTTAGLKSRHPVADLSLARTAVITEFQRHFSLDNCTILCYAPGYADNPQSSLLWMMEQLIHQTAQHGSRFLPLGEPLHREEWSHLNAQGRQIILFGAAFGLLDLAELAPFAMPSNTVIIETGGMKTYRREVRREELHQTLSDVFRLDASQIWSEYGMCEMTSQCYAPGIPSSLATGDQAIQGFSSPHWVQVTIRDPQNPMRICEEGEEGKIGIMDLANVHSCPFFLTEDKGVSLETVDGEVIRFQVLGRWKRSQLRGCNFLIDTD
ncbi:MAG: hypothetical protein DA443_01915 [Bacteroidetes bacterium]|nr:MAG: hypothetical protein DA443_01915 [Bacteroidota bacterium]